MVVDQERRHAFRIDDHVHLRLHAVDDMQRPTEVSRDGAAKMVQQGLGTLRELNFQSSHILSAIRKSHPDISQYLSLLDRKVSILTQLAASAHYGMGMEPNTWVNLSARGVAFDQIDTPYHIGEPLRLQMMLFPSYTLIETRVVVANIYAAPEGDGAHARVGLEFDSLGDHQRELLLRHITERQSEQLRRQRLPR